MRRFDVRDTAHFLDSEFQNQPIYELRLNTASVRQESRKRPFSLFIETVKLMNKSANLAFLGSTVPAM
jgi:hypothetical protein